MALREIKKERHDNEAEHLNHVITILNQRIIADELSIDDVEIIEIAAGRTLNLEDDVDRELAEEIANDNGDLMEEDIEEIQHTSPKHTQQLDGGDLRERDDRIIELDESIVKEFTEGLGFSFEVSLFMKHHKCSYYLKTIVSGSTYNLSGYWCHRSHSNHTSTPTLLLSRKGKQMDI